MTAINYNNNNNLRNNFIQRFSEYYNLANIKHVILKDTLWFDYQKSVIPLGPAKNDYSLNNYEIQLLLKNFSNSLLLRSTTGFNYSNNLENPTWYAIIKDQFVDIDSIKSYEGRKKVRKGLQNCKVEKVNSDFIGKYGYEVFISAFDRYKNKSKPTVTAEEFRMKYFERKSFDDLFHYWGVFYNSKLIGFAENLIYGNIEANYSTMKFCPEYLKYYPSYALIYTMDNFYLNDNNIEYVNDGFRSILHNTNIQEFLIKNLHFKRKVLI